MPNNREGYINRGRIDAQSGVTDPALSKGTSWQSKAYQEGHLSATFKDKVFPVSTEHFLGKQEAQAPAPTVTGRVSKSEPEVRRLKARPHGEPLKFIPSFDSKRCSSSIQALRSHRDALLKAASGEHLHKRRARLIRKAADIEDRLRSTRNELMSLGR